MQAADETTPMQCLHSALWVSGTFEVWEMYFAVNIRIDQSALLSTYVTTGYAVKMMGTQTHYILHGSVRTDMCTVYIAYL